MALLCLRWTVQRCPALCHFTTQLDSHQGGEAHQVLWNWSSGWNWDAHCFQIRKIKNHCLILHTNSSCNSQNLIPAALFTLCTFPLFLYQSVNKPRDWYKSMFRQIHKKPEGKPPPPPLITHSGPGWIPLCPRQVLLRESSRQSIARAK